MIKYIGLFVSLFLSGCIYTNSQQSAAHISERNRLLGALPPERIAYDVQHYGINIDINPEKKYLKGFVDFTALAVNNFTRIQIDLAKSMQLNSVIYDGKKLSTERKYDAVYIIFPKIEMGEVFKFRVNYEGAPQSAKNPPWDGGFVWRKDEQGRDYISVACEGDGCGLWWPLKDHISDEPDNGATMTFTVPENLYCVSNGRLLETVHDKANNKKSFTWEVKNPINNYNISVQLGYYTLVQDTVHRANGKIETLNHYALDYHKEVASTVFPQARRVIRFFEKYFGDYQFWEDGYKLVEVSYLGMEHQSAVTYGNVWSNWGGDHRSWTRDYYGIIDGLLFHETAHEWWGNSITASDPAHVWLHEGTAVYSEAMFIEDQLGYNVMIDFMLKKRDGIKNKKPIVGPENVNHWAFGDSYNKGAWSLHTLRHVIDNNSLWFELIKSFAVDNAKSNVKTEDFISHAESKSGLELDYFFNQYFYDHRIPTLEHYQHEGMFYFKWSTAVNNFNMPIDIEVNGLEIRINPSLNVKSIVVPNYSVIHIKDWEFLINKKENNSLKS